ncbi:uncharacterized protein ACOB8E_020924 isoform 1-T1 [Sarcophilus harrisii]
MLNPKGRASATAPPYMGAGFRRELRPEPGGPRKAGTRLPGPGARAEARQERTGAHEGRDNLTWGSGATFPIQSCWRDMHSVQLLGKPRGRNGSKLVVRHFRQLIEA